MKSEEGAAPTFTLQLSRIERFLLEQQRKVTTMAEPYYKRVLLKLSGEALGGEQGYGIDPNTITAIAREVKQVVALGV